MNADRRGTPRLARRLDCQWQGATGGGGCRITDLSASGCFVETLAAPAVGETTTLTVDLGDEGPTTLSGAVVTVESGIGFAVRFSALAPAVTAHLERFLSAAGTGVSTRSSESSR